MENIAETMSKKRKQMKRERQIIIFTAIFLLAIIIGVSVALLLRNKDDTKTLTINIIQDGNITTKTLTYNNGAKLSDLDNPTVPAGYLFRGWFESDISAEILPLTTAINSDTTLYVRFAKIPTADIVEYTLAEDSYYKVDGFNDKYDYSVYDIVIADMIYNETLDKFLPVKTISERAFYQYGMDSFYMHDFITTIEEYAFYEAGMGNIVFSEGLEHIGESAFNACLGLENITFPKGLKTVGDYAFAGSLYLKSVIIHEGLEYLGEWAFDGCMQLESVILPKGLKTIGWYTFANCTKLTTISLPEELTYLGEGSFRDCTTLESIILPEGLEYIGSCAFMNCVSLKIIIAKGLKIIESDLIEGCTSLESIIFTEDLTYIQSGIFIGYLNLTIYINISEEEAATRFGLNWQEGFKTVRYLGEWYIDDNGIPQNY